ncbi:MAG: hypothetical protein K2N63_00545 [Lachnospiraceae bacterium]|nr:hypothetical protein [Lachnospiraceae bacterium]
MKRNIIATTPEFLSPQELSHQLKCMAVLDIIMNAKEDDWLRRVQKYSKGEAYSVSNGSGDEMDIFFEENGVFIRGFDHENDLNQFGANEWDNNFFVETYAGVPKNFLEIYEEEEQKEYMTFCMWYDYGAACWKQNITEGNDGGKDYLLGFICKDAAKWAEWAEDYYETEIDLAVVEKVYGGGKLTVEDILRLNPERDAKEALSEMGAI